MTDYTRIDHLGWTLEWPTEPGYYLFYGDYIVSSGDEYKPRIKLCEVWSNKDRTRVANGQFLYKSEQAGAFKPLAIDAPDLEALGFDFAALRGES